MRALDLAGKDLRQMLRDWKTALFLVIMPIVFTLLFGFAFGGLGGGEQDARLPVGFLSANGASTPDAERLQALLEASQIVRLDVLRGRSTEWAQSQVRDGRLAGVVLVPAGYALDGSSSQVELIVDEGAAAGSTVRAEVQAAVYRLLGAHQAARLSAQAYDTTVGFAGDTAREAFLDEGLAAAIAAWQELPVGVIESESGAVDTGEESAVMESGFGHTSPSMMVQFSIAGLIGAATILMLERRSRALRRLLTTAITRLEIILGHYLAMVAVILAQLVLLAAFGQFALRVDYLREPLASGLVILATALWTAALGLLIGSLAKNDDQVVIFSLIPMFVLAGMGGAWVPLEFTGKTFQTIGRLLPTAWAMDGFENIVIRGLGLDSVLLGVGIMVGYAVVLFGLSVWRFRFE